jgi:flagellar basal-body rod protein FlgF
MDNLLYISASGAKENMNGLAIRGNNLANVQTEGFRADLEQARAMQAFGEGLPTRVFSMTETPRSDFRPGPIITTDKPMDFAIKGDGFFTVIDENGQERLSRYGSLKITLDGTVVNRRGELIGGLDGPIVVPVPVDDIQISIDGQVSYLPAGAAATERAIAGQLKFMNPPIENLMKYPNGLFGLKDIDNNEMPIDEQDAYNDIQLERYALEGSNVNAVREMVGMIALQRQFEMQIKMMKTAEEIEQSGTQLMRNS